MRPDATPHHRTRRAAAVAAAALTAAGIATGGIHPQPAAATGFGLWNGTAELIPHDGDKGGISTSLTAGRHHQGTEAWVSFAAKGEHLRIVNRLNDTRLIVCGYVSVYASNGDRTGGNGHCTRGNKIWSVNDSFSEGDATEVTMEIRDAKSQELVVRIEKKGGRA